MADSRQILELAKEGVLGQQHKRYKELLLEIEAALNSIQGAAIMMLPGNLDDIKEELIASQAKKLQNLLPEARRLKEELERAGIGVW
ncbi:MAG: hypothetical protein M1438_19935 [Deltaproteobacteria bacterium]|nr:hypothetical protein [Deltaproteobacteria bacterium]